MNTISEQGEDLALQKRIRQAVYDIRYKARKEEIDLRHAYSVYIGKSGLDQNGKEAVQNKLFGKKEEPAESLAVDSVYNALNTVFETAGDNKYKVRVSDKETGKTYVRTASRGKINKLRGKGSVEMTGHGIPKGAKSTTTSAVKKAKGSKSLANLSTNVRTWKKSKPAAVVTKKIKGSSEKEKITMSTLKKEDFIADAAAVAPPKNKKITGEKVDNSKLIKVFPQDKSDPNVGDIKSSYKPVGEVVAEILASETYTVTAADKKANTPAWQGYKAGKKNVKTGKPLYKAADHLKNEEVVKEEGLVDPFYKSVPEEGDDGTGRSMYAKWNNVKNRLRSMGLKCNYELEGDQLIEDAVEYFYDQGITEETIDLIIEEVGLDDFVEFVLDPHQDLVEERAARRASASAPSYEKVKAKVDAGDAARKAAKKGEYATTAAAKRNYGDEEAPEGKPVAKKKAVKKAQPVTPPAKKAVTKKKVTAAVKKVKPTAPAKTPTKKDGIKDGLRSKITSAVKKGVERHKAAVGKAKTEVKKIAKTASATAKQHSQHRKDLVKGLKATPKEKKIAGGIGKAVKKAVTGESVVHEDITDILARLEKKRISKGGNPDESPLGKKTGRAMKAKQDEVRKKAGVKEHHEKDADGNVIPHKTAPLTEGALVRSLLEGKV